MRSHKTRSTRDRSIPRSSQKGVSTKSSISQLTFLNFIILIGFCILTAGPIVHYKLPWRRISWQSLSTKYRSSWDFSPTPTPPISVFHRRKISFRRRGSELQPAAIVAPLCSASCCCNGSVGLNWHTACIYLVPGTYFHPSAGGWQLCSTTRLPSAVLTPTVEPRPEK